MSNVDAEEFVSRACMVGHQHEVLRGSGKERGGGFSRWKRRAEMAAVSPLAAAIRSSWCSVSSTEQPDCLFSWRAVVLSRDGEPVRAQRATAKPLFGWATRRGPGRGRTERVSAERIRENCCDRRL